MKGDGYNQIKNLKINGVAVEDMTPDQMREIAAARMQTNSTAFGALGAIIWRLLDQLKEAEK